MGKPYKQPQKREVMAGSKLEIEMLMKRTRSLLRNPLI